MIYLDNAATTPLLPEVVAAVTDVLTDHFGNPSSLYALGRDASRLLRDSRRAIADSLGATADEILFTSGATEANNTAIISYALSHQTAGRHIVTTAIEHPSVLAAVAYLEERFGFEITRVAPRPDGSFPASLITDALRPDTILVSMMLANNETGQILPVREVAQKLSRDSQIAFHVDATQAVGKIPVAPHELGADFLSASAHKFHGPKGVGFLYHATGTRFDSFLHGGEQEGKRRAGTENLASIVGMARALQLATEHLDKNLSSVIARHDELLSQLSRDGIPFYENKFGPDSLPHVLNIGFPRHNHDILLTQLDLAGIAVSTGSACTAGNVAPSHVLAAIYGADSPKLKENIRVSLSELTTPEDITALTTTLKEIL